MLTFSECAGGKKRLLLCREVVERGVPVLLSSERRSIEHMNLAERLQVPLTFTSFKSVDFCPWLTHAAMCSSYSDMHTPLACRYV